jgi:hypothetical protein
VVDQPRIDLDNLGRRNRQTHALSQPRGEQFIRQHPLVLRIVAELHDVVVPVGTPHEMALRATPHPPYVLHRIDRQTRLPLLLS